MVYRLIDATREDEAWLDQLRRAVYRDLFIATWGGWDEERHQRHFAACIDRGHVSIIHVEGERVGMVQLFDHPDAVEVAEVQIDPAHQGRGIGSTVLRDVIRRAAAQGCPVHLKVGLQNKDAIRLYRRLGFEEVRHTDTHFLMSRPVTI